MSKLLNRAGVFLAEHRHRIFEALVFGLAFAEAFLAATSGPGRHSIKSSTSSRSIKQPRTSRPCRTKKKN